MTELARNGQWGEGTTRRPPVDNAAGTWVVYVFVSRAGEVLYVGSTCHLQQRIREHHYQPWWDETNHVQILAMSDDEQEVRARERREIAERKPLYNDGHRPLSVFDLTGDELQVALVELVVAAEEAGLPRPPVEAIAAEWLEGWCAVHGYEEVPT